MPEASPRSRFTTLLAASTMGVYLLIAVGVTTALANAVSSCPTWPLCAGGWRAALGDANLAIAMAHRATALVVAVLLAVTVVVAWRTETTRRTRAALAAGAALYPAQIAVGAATAVTGAPTVLSGLHLVVAMVLFSALLVALLWHLEATTPAAEDEPTAAAERPEVGADAPDPTPAAADAHDASVTTTPAERGPLARLVATARAYVVLTKPRLWWLLTLVALAAMALAGGPGLDPGLAVATAAGGVLAIAASGTFNNVIERDRDQHMARTADRPVATATIPAWRATAFGVLLAAGSVAVFLAFVNALAAALGLLAILFYSVVYTVVLKPHTDQNTVLGGAAGVFPALIGWAAVEGTVGMPAVVLGAVIFLWTPAHFYNLALVYRDDYARAGFPMLPVVRGAATTRRHIALYLGATMLGAVVLGTATRLDWLYAVAVVALGAAFLWAVVRLFDERDERAAFRAFMTSNAYLGVLLVAVVVDALVV